MLSTHVLSSAVCSITLSGDQVVFLVLTLHSLINIKSVWNHTPQKDGTRSMPVHGSAHFFGYQSRIYYLSLNKQAITSTNQSFASSVGNSIKLGKTRVQSLSPSRSKTGSLWKLSGSKTHLVLRELETPFSYELKKTLPLFSASWRKFHLSFKQLLYSFCCSRCHFVSDTMRHLDEWKFPAFRTVIQ